MDSKRLISIIGAIAFIVFNIVFFLLKPGEMHSGGWISYAFMNISLIVLAGIPWIENSYSIPNLNVATSTIALIYAIATLAAGFVLFAINPENGKIAFVIHLIIMAISAAWIITNVSINRKTADSVELDFEDQLYVKRLAKKVSTLIAECKSDDVKKELEKLYDEVHASPVVAAWDNYSLEHQIENTIDRLSQHIYSSDSDSLIAEVDNIIMELRRRNSN